MASLSQIRCNKPFSLGDAFQFFDEFWVAGNFERVDQMRLEYVGFAYLADRRIGGPTCASGHPCTNSPSSHTPFEFIALFAAKRERYGLVHHSLHWKNDVLEMVRELSSIISRAQH